MSDRPEVIRSRSPEETHAAGETLSKEFRGGELVLLTGPLGAGKSVFARGIAAGLGSIDWRGSPTFNLIHEYSTDPVLYHVDLYRLDAPQAEVLGLEEYALPSSVLLIEWADRALDYLASLDNTGIIRVSLAHAGETERVLSVERDLRRDGSP